MKVKVAQLCPTLCNSPELYSPWNSPSQNTGVGSLFIPQGILPTQGSNPDFPHCRQILYQLSHKVTGVGRLSLLQGIFPTQESNRGLLHGRRITCNDKESPQNRESCIRPLSHSIHFEIALAQGESSWAIKQLI